MTHPVTDLTGTQRLTEKPVAGLPLSLSVCRQPNTIHPSNPSALNAHRRIPSRPWSHIHTSVCLSRQWRPERRQDAEEEQRWKRQQGEEHNVRCVDGRVGGQLVPKREFIFERDGEVRVEFPELIEAREGQVGGRLVVPHRLHVGLLHLLTHTLRRRPILRPTTTSFNALYRRHQERVTVVISRLGRATSCRPALTDRHSPN
mmetsp:Transcript_32834/g.81328  ORF Transcript_32834/g.81328 Transcript_32834/m.81328 type:complete len:202 (+) Transcript_32834:148-753(+)